VVCMFGVWVFVRARVVVLEDGCLEYCWIRCMCALCVCVARVTCVCVVYVCALCVSHVGVLCVCGMYVCVFCVCVCVLCVLCVL